MTIERLLELARGVDPEPIAALATRLLEEWSPPGEEAVVAGLVRDALIAAGAEDVRLDEEIPGSPSVIGWLRGTEPGRTIQWHGHLDAIRTEHGPVRREGDTIYGRGACDMKGALAANVASVQLLRAAGYPRQGNVLMTYHGLHEEGGSRPLVRLIERGIHGDAALIGELGSGRELVTSSRGLTFWELVVRRPGQSLHETNAGPEVIDPLRVGHRLLARLADLRDALAEGRGEPRGTLFIGEFSSGDYFNRVPLTTTIKGTRRHHADATLPVVAAQLDALVEDVRRETGATIDARIQSLAEAYEVDPDHRLGRAVRLAHHDLTGKSMYARGSRASGNAMDFVRRAGIPAFYYGCAYASAHSDNEWLHVSELGRVAAAWALASAYYLDGDDVIAAPDLGEP